MSQTSSLTAPTSAPATQPTTSYLGWLKPLVSFEEDAATVTIFEPTVIPGLLQTEDYARTIHIAGPYTTAPDHVDRWVAARLQRQQRLSGTAPLALHAVISEAALRLEVGGPAVITAQLQRLLDAAEADHITIQVLPSHVRAHPALAEADSMTMLAAILDEH